MKDDKWITANNLKVKITHLRQLAERLENGGLDVFEDYIYYRISETAEPIFENGIKSIKEELTRKADELQKQFDSL